LGASQAGWDPLDDDDEGRLPGSDDVREDLSESRAEGGEADLRQETAEAADEEEPGERRPGGTYTPALPEEVNEDIFEG
jgi:hypothetical protein